MRPRKAIARRAPLARGGKRTGSAASEREEQKYLNSPPRPIKPINRKRKAREWARAYGSPERVAWVASLPCLVCGYGPCENAHIKSGGAGRKADAALVINLCKLHHAEQHHFGIETFGARHGLDLQACAAVLDHEWAFRCASTGGAL